MKWWSAAVGALLGIALFYVGLAQGQILRFSGAPPSQLVPIPAGVTLQAIDGGNTLYNDNGWNYAVTNGWDSPTFYPIGVFLDDIASQADANRYIAMSLNTMFTSFSNQDLSLLRTNAINYIANSGELYTGAASTTGQNGILTFGLQTSLGTETVGLLTVDEPSAYTGDNTGGSAGGKNIANPIQGSPQFGGGVVNSTIQNGRFWWTNFTNAWLGQVPGSVIPVGSDGTQNAVLTTEITSPSSGLTPRHVSFQGLDYYWMSSNPAGIGPPTSAGLYGLPGNMAGVDSRRGTNYGALVDEIRHVTAISGAVRPVFWVVESGGPFTEDLTVYNYIAPLEMDWGIWSAVIHGARGVFYFNNSLGGPQGGGTNFGQPWGLNIQGVTTSASVAGGIMTMAAPASSGIQPLMQITGPNFTAATVLSQITGGPGIGGTYLIDPPSTTATQTVTILQTVSTTSAAASTNLLIKKLAPIVNANYALGYVTVNPGGYLYGTSYMQINNGIDVVAKYYTGSNITAPTGETLGPGYYIFAQTRAAETTTGIAATFTLAGSASTVTVIGESRSIPVTNGVFTDTFAYSWIKHIYRVDGPGLLTTTAKHFYVTTTGTSTVAVPSDWNNSKTRSIEVIGGGGGGGDGDFFHAGGSGGGGGAYCKISNPTYTPGENITAFVGTGGIHGAPAGAGGNTTFYFTGNAGLAIQANGGAGSTDGGSPAGGAGGTCVIGTVKNSGGAGGNSSSSVLAAAGGGGAGGPNGVGARGGNVLFGGSTGGSGGGGNGGGSQGVDGTATTGGGAIPGKSGGNNSFGSGGAAGGQGNISGGNGIFGGGGGGGGSQNGISLVPGFQGGNGGTGIEWDLTHGSGGGAGGGGAGFDSTETPSIGGTGGSYGGGGGGGSHNASANGNGGNGAPGIIVFTYIP